MQIYRQPEQVGPRNLSQKTPTFIRWPSRFPTDINRKRLIGNKHSKYEYFKETFIFRVYYTFGNKNTGVYLQMTENGPDFVNETSFGNFPEFQRIHNADGSFSLKAKKHEQLVALDNCTTFNLPRPGEGLISTCTNKSFPLNEKLRLKRQVSKPIDDPTLRYDPEPDLVKEKIKLATVPSNSFNFIGSPSQLTKSVLCRKEKFGNRDRERTNKFVFSSRRRIWSTKVSKWNPLSTL